MSFINFCQFALARKSKNDLFNVMTSLAGLIVRKFTEKEARGHILNLDTCTVPETTLN